MNVTTGSSVFASLLCPLIAISQITETKLTRSDGSVGDAFGRSVSISGDYVIIGAYSDDDIGNSSGAAYIFRRMGAIWMQTKLVASDGADYDFFGASVSVSGDFAIIGAPRDDENGNSSGSAYVFRREDTSWVEEAKITPSDGVSFDYFGTAVSISGDLAVVGAPGYELFTNPPGAAYVFRREGTDWVEEAKLLADDGADNDYFGFSVFVSGDYAIIGAHGNDDNGAKSGSAYIFKREGLDWIEEAKLIASDGQRGDFFGHSVSLSGDYAIIGAPYDDDDGIDAGSGYVFKWDGSEWIENVKLNQINEAARDWFGYSVSISGDYAVVGSVRDDDNGSSSGSAYIYKLDGITWIEHATHCPRRSTP